MILLFKKLCLREIKNSGRRALWGPWLFLGACEKRKFDFYVAYLCNVWMFLLLIHFL